LLSLFGPQAYTFVFRIGDNIEELFDTFASDRRHDAKFGKMGADRVETAPTLGSPNATISIEMMPSLGQC
jgi:hypothetical protein